MGASISTILLLLTTLIVFRYWDKGTVSRIQKRRSDSAEAEFPSIVELFAVLVSAGESPSTAMLRVTERADGEMSRKFAGALIELKNGKSLSQSLEALGGQVSSPTIRRFCDTLILAIERGTSLSEVLNRQVEEVRAGQHALLLTAAGKAEISLMIPVVFLILPISVLFALWPSYVSLGQSVM
jgi:tight adherence protein C